MSNQKNEMAALHKKIFKQDRQISRLMQRLLLCEGMPATSPNKDKAEADLTTIENKENRIRRQAIVAVAFSVCLTHSIQHMSGPRNIAFDHVETNIGNGYNSLNGEFTAPVSGTYVFYTSVLAFNDDELRCQLVVNGMNKAHVYARGTDDLHDQGGQAIIVQLQVGDYVAVQNSAYDDSIYGGIYSTFSGFLLMLDYTQPGAIVG